MVSEHRSRHAKLVTGGLVAFLVVTSLLLLGGYLFDWRWTGYRNDKGEVNRLWDWLTLLLLPVTLALIPLWLESHERHRRDWHVLGSAAAVTFVVLVIGGYRFHWAWTGFTGNTLWQWLGLFLMPFLMPLVLLFVLRRNAPAPTGPPPPGLRRPRVSAPAAAVAGALIGAVVVAGAFSAIRDGLARSGRVAARADPAVVAMQRVTVIAKDPYWTDTTLTVRRGEHVRVVAVGQVSAKDTQTTSWPPVGPGGGPHKHAKSLVKRWPHAELLATVGRPGDAIPLALAPPRPPMPVGAGGVCTVGSDGELFLGINDKNTGDNSGYFAATIALTPAGAAN